MKTFLAVVVLLSALMAIHAQDTDQLLSYFKECAGDKWKAVKDAKASELPIKDIIKISREGCVVQCVYEKAGVIENGKFVVGNMEQLGLPESITSKVAGCEKHIKGDDLCKETKKFSFCLYKPGKRN